MQSRKFLCKNKFLNFSKVMFFFQKQNKELQISFEEIQNNYVEQKDPLCCEDDSKREQIILDDGKIIEKKFDSVEKVYKAVVEILISQLCNPELNESNITLDTNFMTDLNADSLDLIEMVVSFEECFDITIPDDLTFKVQTMQQAVELVIELREAKGFSHKS